MMPRASAATPRAAVPSWRTVTAVTGEEASKCWSNKMLVPKMLTTFSKMLQQFDKLF
jgi:hypothetical protein